MLIVVDLLDEIRLQIVHFRINMKGTGRSIPSFEKLEVFQKIDLRSRQVIRRLKLRYFAENWCNMFEDCLQLKYQTDKKSRQKNK